jgi:5-methylcytosine-specific restriction endonuclease McrA
MGLREKCPRVKPSPTEYQSLHNQALERDRRRCQECGSLRNQQVHHLRPRSQLGGDALTNLITLCARCHGKRHGR